MAIHYKGGDPAAAAGGKPQRKLGRPPNAARAAGEQEPPRPEARRPTFACKWRGCVAKLHNLDTLRRHVRMVHGVSSGGGEGGKGAFECWWEGCGKKISIMDPRTGSIGEKHQYLSFDDFAVWTHHVEQSHLAPIGWQQGDGPAAGFSGSFPFPALSFIHFTQSLTMCGTDGRDSEVSDAYLSDARGRQVTPRARLPPGAEGITAANAAYVVAGAAAMSKRKAEAEAQKRREEARARNGGADEEGDVEMEDGV
jgi:hypothetical protein